MSENRIRGYAAKLGIQESDEGIPWCDAFPEFHGNEAGTVISGYRHREGMTQAQLAEAIGIPQRHISEMENGKRIIGVVNAKRLATALHCDHRRLLKRTEGRATTAISGPKKNPANSPRAKIC